ncbi:MAG: TetR/AcrR family transcriptional regulator [Bryobacteraceae bacterium]|jgi:AcrR family transcriptional regulator
MIDTRQKILDAAERLFGEQGYGATSLRHIIAEAGVNLAAIHYHFGTKEDLLDQLIMRKGGPVNAERLALLDALEAEAKGKAVPLEKLLEAFLGPPMMRVGKNPEFARLMGRMYGEGLMPLIVERHFQTVAKRFFAALARTLPHLTPGEMALRSQFMVGAMAHILMVKAPDVKAMTGASPPRGSQHVLRELVAFLSGGLRAPAARKARRRIHK